MTCTCTRDNERRVGERVSQKLGVAVEVTAQCVAICMTEDLTPVERSFMPYSLKADKPGYRKGKDMSVFFSYCPWCGVKVDGQDKTDSAGAPA